MITMFVEDPPYLEKRERPPLTAIGFAFLTLWLATLNMSLDRGQELDWFGSATIPRSVTISALAFVAFLVRELTTSQPLVNLGVFLNRNFAVGTGIDHLARRAALRHDGHPAALHAKPARLYGNRCWAGTESPRGRCLRGLRCWRDVSWALSARAIQSSRALG